MEVTQHYATIKSVYLTSFLLFCFKYLLQLKILSFVKSYMESVSLT
jgi:hypothetical protein